MGKLNCPICFNYDFKFKNKWNMLEIECQECLMKLKLHTFNININKSKKYGKIR